jgi:hypothetical protein
MDLLAYRVVASRQVVGKVQVQALDAAGVNPSYAGLDQALVEARMAPPEVLQFVRTHE